MTDLTTAVLKRITDLFLGNENCAYNLLCIFYFTCRTLNLTDRSVKKPKKQQPKTNKQNKGPGHELSRILAYHRKLATTIISSPSRSS